MNEMRLYEFAGQKCDVVMTRISSGEILIRFENKEGYGYPSLDENKLLKLLKTIEVFKQASEKEG